MHDLAHGLKFCLSYKCSGDTDVAGPGTTVWVTKDYTRMYLGKTRDACHQSSFSLNYSQSWFHNRKKKMTLLLQPPSPSRVNITTLCIRSFHCDDR